MIPRDMKENKVLFHLHHHHIDHHIIGGCSPEGPKSNAGAAQTGLFSVKEKVKQNAWKCFVEQSEAMIAKQITRNTWE